MKALLAGVAALVLCACSGSEQKAAAAASAPAATPAAAPVAAPPPAAPAVASVPPTAECKTLKSPQSGALQPLDIATSSGTAHFQVELADNEAQREYGLMCRSTLAPDRGMLFDFHGPYQGAFWMKNTLIPLDILFIGADGRIITIARNARPLDETPIPSNGIARTVLELPGGRAAQIGALPGDVVTYGAPPAR